MVSHARISLGKFAQWPEGAVPSVGNDDIVKRFVLLTEACKADFDDHSLAQREACSLHEMALREMHRLKWY